ncbi:MAG: hypothetical protein M0R51_11635 [Clostridia bacterium]|jgi:hypothetical protein|nr:hypothetical protein [Clostridia bacterium]
MVRFEVTDKESDIIETALRYYIADLGTEEYEIQQKHKDAAPAVYKDLIAEVKLIKQKFEI